MSQIKFTQSQRSFIPKMRQNVLEYRIRQKRHNMKHQETDQFKLQRQNSVLGQEIEVMDREVEDLVRMSKEDITSKRILKNIIIPDDHHLTREQNALLWNLVRERFIEGIQQMVSSEYLSQLEGTRGHIPKLTELEGGGKDYNTGNPIPT